MPAKVINLRIADPERGRINFGLTLRANQATDELRVWRGQVNAVFPDSEGDLLRIYISKEESRELQKLANQLLCNRMKRRVDGPADVTKATYLVRRRNEAGEYKTAEYYTGSLGGVACAELEARMQGLLEKNLPRAAG